ncbi:MAG: hypothetical protein JSU99_05150 [Nitrospiraceae bacterium]|nr:MAG: hypothetical protein JSU99_05150 [Nitrospiraceae bacterium]
MKIINVLFIIPTIVFSIAVLFNEYYYSDFETTLSEGIYLQAGNEDLSAPNWSVPLVYDWNDDDKKDLLIGRHFRDRAGNVQGQGFVTFYENRGTDDQPAFDGHSNIQTCTTACRPVDVASSG